jgi:hypothetical protein
MFLSSGKLAQPPCTTYPFSLDPSPAAVTVRIAIGFVALLTLGSFVALMAYCEHVENPVVEFATYGDALEAGAVARGWIPSFVPPSATRIRDAHNLDTNHQWLQFDVPDRDARAMVGEMHNLSGEDPRCVQPGRWSVPSRRVGRQPDLASLPHASTYLHSERGRALCVVVNWSLGRVYAWTSRQNVTG